MVAKGRDDCLYNMVANARLRNANIAGSMIDMNEYRPTGAHSPVSDHLFEIIWRGVNNDMLNERVSEPNNVSGRMYKTMMFRGHYTVI